MSFERAVRGSGRVRCIPLTTLQILILDIEALLIILLQNAPAYPQPQKDTGRQRMQQSVQVSKHTVVKTQSERNFVKPICLTRGGANDPWKKRRGLCIAMFVSTRTPCRTTLPIVTPSKLETVAKWKVVKKCVSY